MIKAFISVKTHIIQKNVPCRYSFFQKFFCRFNFVIIISPVTAHDYLFALPES